VPRTQAGFAVRNCVFGSLVRWNQPLHDPRPLGSSSSRRTALLSSIPHSPVPFGARVNRCPGRVRDSWRAVPAPVCGAGPDGRHWRTQRRSWWRTIRTRPTRPPAGHGLHLWPSRRRSRSTMSKRARLTTPGVLRPRTRPRPSTPPPVNRLADSARTVNLPARPFLMRSCSTAFAATARWSSRTPQRLLPVFAEEFISDEPPCCPHLRGLSPILHSLASYQASPGIHYASPARSHGDPDHPILGRGLR